MQIGIGTYSFGGIETMFGLGPTLQEKFRAIKALGYDSVELLAVDLQNNSAEDIRKWADEAGLKVTSVHAEPNEEVIEKMARIGGSAVIWPSTAFCDKAEAAEVAKILEEQAALGAKYGIKVGFHNHSKEFYFDEGKTLLEHLLDSGTGFYLQLDCGWAQNGGMYPPTFIRKYRNRVISIHVKENCKVMGPGPRPASRHAEQPQRAQRPDVSKLSIEERKAMYEEMMKRFAARGDDSRERMKVQCAMGAPESNMNWQEIKNALDEQDFEAFWVVEREEFYTDHDQCLADDCRYLRENVK